MTDFKHTEMMSEPHFVCGCEDHPEQGFGALGTGNWRGCHGIGDYHALSVKVMNEIPEHLRQPYGNGTVWDEITKRVTEAYSQISLMIYWDGRSPHNTELTFVPPNSSWIGLAIVGNGLSCSSAPIWLRLDRSYTAGRPVETILRYYTILVMHEIGHNTGAQHRPGGIMNAGILPRDPTWFGDPHEDWMKQRHGGDPVKPTPPPPPPPPPPDTWWKRILRWLLSLLDRFRS